MFSKKKDKSRDLYYLFPISGEGNRNRYYRNVKWSLFIGAVVSTLVGMAIYFSNHL